MSTITDRSQQPDIKPISNIAVEQVQKSMLDNGIPVYSMSAGFQDVIRVEFRLGFRIQQRVNLMFRKVVEELVENNEVNITSRYESLERNNIVGDFQFIVMEKYLSSDNELPFFEKVIMKLHFWLKDASLSEERGFGLDPSFVTLEKFPLMVSPVTDIKLKRVE